MAVKSPKERKYKCKFCGEPARDPQVLWSHIKSKHPDFLNECRVNPPDDNPETAQTGNASSIEKKESENGDTNPAAKAEESSLSEQEIQEMVNKSRTLEGENKDLKTKLEANEEEESTRRTKMAEEEVSRRVERLEAEKKEAEKQERLRKRQEQDAKIDQLVKGQEEQGQKLTLIGNMVCDEKGNCRLSTKEDMTTFPTKEELQGSLGALKQDVILALKPEETKEEKKEEEEAKPETEVSEKDKQILEDFPKVRDHVNALTGEQKDSPFGVLAAAAKHAQQTILDSNKGKPQELVEYIPDALKEVIRESGAPETVKKHLESMKPEDIAKYITEQCTGEHCKPITLALRGMGINVQKKREGGGMLGGEWEEIS